MSEETALAKNFAEFSDEQIAAYPQTARSHIVGLADLCDSKSAELSALRERVKELEETLRLLYDHCRLYHPAVENNNVGTTVQALLSTRREEG